MPGNLLVNSKIFGDMRAEHQTLFEQMARRMTLKKGQTLFFQDDPGDALYVVEEGSIEISVLGENGKKLSLNVMRPLDVFGEIAALDGGPRTATATAWEPCVVHEIRRSHILDAISTHPAISAEMVKILCDRMRWISQQIEDLALLDIETRLAKRVLILHDKFSDQEGYIHFSQSELADFSGATRETINKTLQLWRSNDVIVLSRGTLKINNFSRLEQLAGLN